MRRHFRVSTNYQVVEEFWESLARAEGKLEGHLGTDISEYRRLSHFGGNDLPHAVRVEPCCVLLLHGHVVAYSEDPLEEQRGAAAAKFTVAHDGDAVSQEVFACEEEE